jgi:chromatin segregation and condensation protein Rec8/ScpA/Scc1 (kleisin family)
MAYEVSTEVFEGPFDLLLHLILREQVDIHEISLARIVDAYLAEIERLQALDLDVATEFVLIAATLVELKARRLLPGREDVDLDDELALWEERDLLLARLLECKTFKDAARVLARRAERAARSFPRTAGLGSTSSGWRRTRSRESDPRTSTPRSSGPRHRGRRPASTPRTSPPSGCRWPTRWPSWSTSSRASGGSRSGRSPPGWSSASK